MTTLTGTTAACAGCGSTLSVGALFCVACGTPVPRDVRDAGVAPRRKAWFETEVEPEPVVTPEATEPGPEPEAEESGPAPESEATEPVPMAEPVPDPSTAATTASTTASTPASERLWDALRPHETQGLVGRSLAAQRAAEANPPAATDAASQWAALSATWLREEADQPIQPDVTHDHTEPGAGSPSRVVTEAFEDRIGRSAFFHPSDGTTDAAAGPEVIAQTPSEPSTPITRPVATVTQAVTPAPVTPTPVTPAPVVTEWDGRPGSVRRRPGRRGGRRGEVPPPPVDVTATLLNPIAKPSDADLFKVDPPKVDPPKVDPPKVDPPKVDPPTVDPPKVDAAPVVAATPLRDVPLPPDPPDNAPRNISPVRGKGLSAPVPSSAPGFDDDEADARQLARYATWRWVTALVAVVTLLGVGTAALIWQRNNDTPASASGPAQAQSLALAAVRAWQQGNAAWSAGDIATVCTAFDGVGVGGMWPDRTSCMASEQQGFDHSTPVNRAQVGRLNFDSGLAQVIDGDAVVIWLHKATIDGQPSTLFRNDDFAVMRVLPGQGWRQIGARYSGNAIGTVSPQLLASSSATGAGGLSNQLTQPSNQLTQPSNQVPLPPTSPPNGSAIATPTGTSALFG